MTSQKHNCFEWRRMKPRPLRTSCILVQSRRVISRCSVTRRHCGWVSKLVSELMGLDPCICYSVIGKLLHGMQSILSKGNRLTKYVSFIFEIIIYYITHAMSVPYALSLKSMNLFSFIFYFPTSPSTHIERSVGTNTPGLGRGKEGARNETEFQSKKSENYFHKTSYKSRRVS